MKADLLNYLKSMVALKAYGGSKPDGFVYTNNEEFVLHHGEFFKSNAFDDKKYSRALRTKKECFRNAFELALMNDNLVYCEGYAVDILPLHHAWCVEKDTGKVVDPTWNNPESCIYFGVPFKLEFARHTVVSNEIYGVLDGYWNHEFPLLTGKATDFKEEI